MTNAAFLDSGSWDQIQLLLTWFKHSFSEHLSSSWILCTKCMYGMQESDEYRGSNATRAAPDLGIE